MNKIGIIKSSAVMLVADNVDTDQIIPSRFLKATSRSGFGDALFAEWRANDDFCLNVQRGSILVTGVNFGCGSSREHAVWAIYDYGFRAVLATSFADIFYSNALNNGLLPIKISRDFLDFLKVNNSDITINLERQTVEVGFRVETFDIERHNRASLLNGIDDIDYLIGIKDEIESYEIKNSITIR